MTTRLLPYATDYITPTQIRSLRRTLADFLPFSSKAQNKLTDQRFLDPTHHLIYFPSVPNASLLLPDGTDSWHSPGPPFTRRLWAGGSMTFLRDIPVNGDPFHCVESIADVQITGKEGEEKIFVRVERVIFAGKYPGELKGHLEIGVRLMRLKEQRTLVFMRDNRQEGFPAVSQTSNKALKPLQTPDFSHAIVPTRELLFRFSALTFNAHAIHLDKQFCREVEGHRNLLVHGPLTAVLMVEVLRNHLQTLMDLDGLSSAARQSVNISHVEYRNLVPLYAEEEMNICVRRRGKEFDDGKVVTWDVWIEGPDGGYAVKGTAKTVTGKRFLKSRVERAIPGHEMTPQERSLEGDSVPAEQVALQRDIHPSHEDVSNEENSPEGDLSPKEKTENETDFEGEDETEDESAPYFQR